MSKRLLFIFQLILVVTLFSCKSYKPIASTSDAGVGTVDYVDRYKGLAVSEMKRTGIPASITLAQAIIESDYGRSTLAREANNHFGIKCHNDWSGPTIRHHDDRRNECFRKYRKPEESYYDHSDFLKSGSRYSFLFKLSPTDYKGWAHGLKKAGYATNPQYANMLIKKIEQYNLWYYDSGYNDNKGMKPKEVSSAPESDYGKGKEAIVNSGLVFDEKSVVSARIQRVMEVNRVQYVIVKEEDTKDKVEEEFQLLKWELAKYNELESDFALVPGQILYLQPKRDKAEPGKEFHTLVAGETMYKISQQYGIKLKRLYDLNRMSPGSEPTPGTKLWLRRMKVVR